MPTITQPTGYWYGWRNGLATTVAGLRLTARHFWRAFRRRKPGTVQQPGYFSAKGGGVTIQYPQEQIPVPDAGRYRLFVEIDDCIGCDQCARVCPVDCITIDKVRAVDDLGTTTDGTKIKFYLPTFDIDLAKCCYCGLCTVVCPTECIVMTKSHDHPETDRRLLNYHFGNLGPAEAATRQAEWDAHEAEQKRLKAEALAKAAAQKAAPATDSPAAENA
jgi:formate hydrogenlyase subunit 6/NADH:ubiquinone oxidoreductase subunit I